jgi:hypothetical protein
MTEKAILKKVHMHVLNQIYPSVHPTPYSENSDRRGRGSTIIRVACFIKKVNNIFNIKMS